MFASKRLTVVSLLVVATARPGFSESPTPKTKDLTSATKTLASKFDSLVGEIAKAPEPIDVTRWNNLHQGSEQLLATVKQLKATREGVLAAAKNIGTAIGDFRAEIERVRQNYLELERSARAQIDGTDGGPSLVEPLLGKARSETELYASAARSCDAMASQFSKQQAGLKEQLMLIDRSGPMLARLEKAAELYGQLAELGSQAEQMNRDVSAYAEQLNALLKAFALLDSQTKEVISDLSPKTITKASQVSETQLPASANLGKDAKEDPFADFPPVRKSAGLPALDGNDRDLRSQQNR